MSRGSPPRRPIRPVAGGTTRCPREAAGTEWRALEARSEPAGRPWFVSLNISGWTGHGPARSPCACSGRAMFPARLRRGARGVSRSWLRVSRFGPRSVLWPPSGSWALCSQSWVVACLHLRRLLPGKMLAVALHPQQVWLTLSVDQICTGSLGGKAATSEGEAAGRRAALVPQLCPGARGSGCRLVCVSWRLGGGLGAGPGAAAPALSCSAGVRPPPVLLGSEEAAGAAARRR